MPVMHEFCCISLRQYDEVGVYAVDAWGLDKGLVAPCLTELTSKARRSVSSD